MLENVSRETFSFLFLFLTGFPQDFVFYKNMEYNILKNMIKMFHVKH